MTVTVVLSFSVLKIIAKHEYIMAYFDICVFYFSVSVSQCFAHILVRQFKWYRPRSEIEYDYVEVQLIIPTCLSKMVIYMFTYVYTLYIYISTSSGSMAPLLHILGHICFLCQVGK